MQRHRNDGLRKVCGCDRRRWAKCPHPWHFSFKGRGGPRYRLSLDKHLGRRIATKTEAEHEAARLRAAIREGRFGDQVSDLDRMTLKELSDVYFERYKAIHCSGNLANERSFERVIMRTVLPQSKGRARPFGEWPVRAITSDTLERFKEVRLAERQGQGKVSINRCLKLLRHMFNWAILKGYLETTPFKRGTVTVVRLFPEQPRQRRFLEGEEERLLAACGRRLRALVEAALETCCRKGELLSLQWRQVRWAQNEIHLPAGKTKSRKDRFIPISQRLQAILEMRRCDPNGDPLPLDGYVFGNEIGQSVKSVKRAWATACRKAGITDLRFHDLRREAASRLLEGHVPEQYVQAVLGHADLSTTSKYLATTRKGMHQIMRQYERDRSGVIRPERPGGSAASGGDQDHAQ